MNRTLQALLTIFLCIPTAFGQDADPTSSSQRNDTTVMFQEQDSLPSGVDGILQIADSSVVKETVEPHSPSKAVMYALVLPGLGQGYNRKYYKIPIVYAALGGAGYAIIFNSRKYRDSAHEYALNPDDTNERYLQFWRRNMELSYIALTVVYALQVVDAYVDAQLYNWDVNEDLSLRVAPSLQPMMAPVYGTGQSFGLTCSLNFKGR
ncbi:MAG: DUF5683 domain-containing protein [Bacteroidales bacterium]